jgi:hypothetical protein
MPYPLGGYQSHQLEPPSLPRYGVGYRVSDEGL